MTCFSSGPDADIKHMRSACDSTKSCAPGSGRDVLCWQGWNTYLSIHSSLPHNPVQPASSKQTNEPTGKLSTSPAQQPTAHQPTAHQPTAHQPTAYLLPGEARRLQDGPQVADDVSLLSDDLITHSHLKLQLLQADSLSQTVKRDCIQQQRPTAETQAMAN